MFIKEMKWDIIFPSWPLNNFLSIAIIYHIYKLFKLTSFIVFQDVEERIKNLSPIMFEDFAQPFQIDLDKVFLSYASFLFMLIYGREKGMPVVLRDEDAECDGIPK